MDIAIDFDEFQVLTFNKLKACFKLDQCFLVRQPVRKYLSPKNNIFI